MKKRLRNYRLKAFGLATILLPLIASDLIHEIVTKAHIVDIMLSVIVLIAVLGIFAMLFLIKFCYWCGEDLE